jgi:hypothetical protein
LKWGTCQDDFLFTVDLLDCLSGLSFRVLDDMGFIQHNIEEVKTQESFEFSSDFLIA